MSELILHHYPGSPFAEKARLMLGFKGLPWRSVVIPRWMPKPDLLPLTGGYRRTPVMQIGADVYCDTACIAAELERRFPTLTLFPPGTRGTAHMIGAWADKTLFLAVVAVVFGTHAETLPKELKDDRFAFSGGMIDAERYRADQPHLRAQLQGHLAFLEAALSDERLYLLGAKPSYADFCAYGPVWMLANRAAALGLLDASPRLTDWYSRMTAVGHGMVRDLDAKEALNIALEAQPEKVEMMVMPRPPGSDLAAGTRVVVAPDDYGKDPVEGYLLGLTQEEIVVRRGDPLVGEVNVHFPRAGYRLTPG